MSLMVGLLRDTRCYFPLTRTTLMNTKGVTFFGLEWANKAANNYVCDRCGYVLWFLDKP